MTDKSRLGTLPGNLAFYTTPPHECSYLPREAITLFADPRARMDMVVYSTLVEVGFRRSGEYVYRPRCIACAACLPARIPAAAFQPNRSQRRTWARNADIAATVCGAAFRSDHFDLYRRYVKARHAGGGMDVDDPSQYITFLNSSWCDTRFVEFRVHGRLLAVAVVDLLLQGLSAVYTFYDPDEERRSLGVYAVLWLVEEARRRRLPGVYLGYYIRECAKMSYKANYRPLEVFRDGIWQGLPDAGQP